MFHMILTINSDCVCVYTTLTDRTIGIETQNPLVADIPPRRTGYDPGSIHAWFVVDAVALQQVFLQVQYFCFPLSLSFSNARYLSSSSYYADQKDKLAKAKKLQTNIFFRITGRTVNKSTFTFLSLEGLQLPSRRRCGKPTAHCFYAVALHFVVYLQHWSHFHFQGTSLFTNNVHKIWSSFHSIHFILVRPFCRYPLSVML